jgi:hypothetical protein
MTILLVTALHAAETLVAFHRHRAGKSTGAARAYHKNMARRCTEDAEYSRREIEAAAVIVENQIDDPLSSL